jgi:hypothetical protein
LLFAAISIVIGTYIYVYKLLKPWGFVDDNETQYDALYDDHFDEIF